jgi:hypothetical protein
VAVHAAAGDADSWSVERASEFERVLEAHLAAASFPFCLPQDGPPVVDARPDPAIRLAMWGAGAPQSEIRFRSPAGRVRSTPSWTGSWPDGGHAARADQPKPGGQWRTTAAGEAAPAPRQATPDGHGGPALGVRPGERGARVAGPAASPAASAGSAREADAARPPVSRIARRLSEADRASLDVLRRSGANLPDDFTPDELKAAFRQLAFRFHPDQHPGATAAERLALGRSFAQVHAAYRGLRQLPVQRQVGTAR